MPLLVTDYSWTQTDTMVYIHVPLKGAKVGKVDVISTDEYLKVHYPPYLLEVFLLEHVDDDRSTARVGNGVVYISLPKKTKNIWNHLMITTNDKEKKKVVRERALLKYNEKSCSECRSKVEKQHAQKKYALERSMKLEKEETETIQKMRDIEKERANTEFASWQLGQKQKEDEAAQNGCSDDGKLDQRGSVSKYKKKQAHLPAPRRVGNIQVTFTPRVFPTALRESRVQEEEEWLIKQAEARNALNADVEELKFLEEEDRNPDWLKDKGDKCYATGDHLSAVNAYNLAIRINRKIPALYSNRAACHLKLGNFHKAIEDSSKALDLLTPPVAANAAARARAHVRRGSAFSELQLYAEGLQDFQAAIKIYPHNEALQADTQRLRDIIQGSVFNPETQ